MDSILANFVGSYRKLSFDTIYLRTGTIVVENIKNGYVLSQLVNFFDCEGDIETERSKNVTFSRAEESIKL